MPDKLVVKQVKNNWRQLHAVIHTTDLLTLLPAFQAIDCLPFVVATLQTIVVAFNIVDAILPLLTVVRS